jgi:hypothetical protein
MGENDCIHKDGADFRPDHNQVDLMLEWPIR